MTGSGLIYAAIVVAWVAYLVPSWVRRGEGRTHVERSTDGMRVLDRGRAKVAPGHVDPAEHTEQDRSALAVSPRTARRRRRTLALLVLSLVGLAVGAVLGLLAPWAPLVPALALVGYCWALRRSVRRMALARRRAEARREVRRVAGPSPVRRPEPKPVAPAVEPAAEPTVAAVTLSASVETTSAAPVAGQATSTAAAASGATWEPQPVPLPTYVTAPKAARPIRTIDLSTPGAWTSGRLDPLAVGTPMPSWVGAPGATSSPQEEPTAAPEPAIDEEPTGEIEVPRAVGD